jgi:subtilisin family serine protease
MTRIQAQTLAILTFGVGALFDHSSLMASSASIAPTSSDRYFVEFKGTGVPADLTLRIAALGGTVVDSYPKLQVAIVGGMTSSAAATLAAQADVADVTADEPIPVPTLAGRRGAPDAGQGVVPASVTQPQTAVYYPYQWNMRAIAADRAWNQGFLGSPDVRVAILDTGIDATNPDLAGLVDTTRSTSFCAGEEPYINFQFPGRPAWTDIVGHGTFVASIAASQGRYVAGVTSRTTVMAVKVAGFACGSFSDLFRGIYYATDNGADVINMSLGVPFIEPKAGQRGFFHYLHIIAQYALIGGVNAHVAGSHGVSAFVVAAGNSGFDLDHDASGFVEWCDVPGVICVSATGPTNSGPVGLGPFLNVDAFAAYSNFGASAIAVAAPGGNLTFDGSGNPVFTSTVLGACSSTDRMIDPVRFILVPGICSSQGLVATAELGTSMAAPHVAGLAALLVAQLGHGNASQVRAAIESSADDLGKPGADPFYGRGRINVPRALGIQ